MRLIISGEQPFQILGTSFGVSASESDYTILYSIDGQTYTTLKSVNAGENVNISGRAIGTFYKLSGNTSTVEVVYGKTCEEIAGVGSINGETGEISLKTINGNSIIGEGNIDIEGGESNTFVITMNEETGEPSAIGFNAAYEAAGGNLTVLLNVVERVIPAKEIRVENGGYNIDFAAYSDFDNTGNEEVITPFFITEDDQVSELPIRRMTITEAYDDLDRYATRIVPITQSQYDAMPEERIQRDTLYIIID